MKVLRELGVIYRATTLKNRHCSALRALSPRDEANLPQRARELHDRQVVLRLLLIADDDPAAAVQPADRPLHYPAPGLVPLAALGIFLLLADLPTVRLVAEDAGGRVRRCAAERLVQTKVLLMLARVRRL